MVSIALVRCIGIAGVFIGTCVSFGLTAFWRAPFILCRQGFHRSTGAYWLRYAGFAAFTLYCCVLYSALGVGAAAGWVQWLVKAVVCALAYAALFTVVFWQNGEFRGLLRGLSGLRAHLRR